jgi:hypothetical protein
LTSGTSLALLALGAAGAIPAGGREPYLMTSAAGVLAAADRPGSAVRIVSAGALTGARFLAIAPAFPRRSGSRLARDQRTNHVSVFSSAFGRLAGPVPEGWQENRAARTATDVGTWFA